MNGHRRIRGVALIVANPAGRILVLRELEDKPPLGKFAGDWSIPMETLEPGESHFDGLCRLVREELPGLSADRISLWNAPVGSYRIAPRVWATLYVALASTFDLPSPNGDREVESHEWAHPAEVLERQLRCGAAEMIDDFVGRNTKVRRTACRRIVRPSS